MGEVAFFEFGQRRYRGKCAVVANQAGGLTVINEVMIDDWLKGVLPAEIGDAPPEALKAQAVAARSPEGLAKLARSSHAPEGFDFCSAEHCMAYKGCLRRNRPANAAVDGTLGLVLVAGNDILDAVFHLCGGVTCGPDEVWTAKPKSGLVSIADSPMQRVLPPMFDEAGVARFLQDAGTDFSCSPGNAGYPSYASKYFRWVKTPEGAELERACGVGALRDPGGHGAHGWGRVRTVTAAGERGTKTFEKELIRRATLERAFVLTTSHGGGNSPPPLSPEPEMATVWALPDGGRQSWRRAA